jgi:hypothetical protein
MAVPTIPARQIPSAASLRMDAVGHRHDRFGQRCRRGLATVATSAATSNENRTWLAHDLDRQCSFHLGSYNKSIKVTFDPAKRARTLAERGLDFAEAVMVFEASR